MTPAHDDIESSVNLLEQQADVRRVILQVAAGAFGRVAGRLRGLFKEFF